LPINFKISFQINKVIKTQNSLQSRSFKYFNAIKVLDQFDFTIKSLKKSVRKMQHYEDYYVGFCNDWELTLLFPN